MGKKKTRPVRRDNPVVKKGDTLFSPRYGCVIILGKRMSGFNTEYEIMVGSEKQWVSSRLLKGD